MGTSSFLLLTLLLLAPTFALHTFFYPNHMILVMLQIADISHAPSEQPALAAVVAAHAEVARCAKWVVELDRCHAAMEAGYHAGLFQVLGAEQMAKNDLLLGVPGPIGRKPSATGEASEAQAVANSCLEAAAEAVVVPALAVAGGDAEARGGFVQPSGLTTAAAAEVASLAPATVPVVTGETDRWAPCRAALQDMLMTPSNGAGL
jgi:hypothetical protein